MKERREKIVWTYEEGKIEHRRKHLAKQPQQYKLASMARISWHQQRLKPACSAHSSAIAAARQGSKYAPYAKR